LPPERALLNYVATLTRVRDPLADATALRAAPTVRDLVERYQLEILPSRRPNTRREYSALLDNEILPALGSVKVSAATHAEIDALHRRMSARAPYRANRLAALLSRLFALAIRWGWRTDNPAKGVERNAEEPRERFLSGAEMTRLIDTLYTFNDQQVADIVRVMILTGARKSEVLNARWDQFDDAGRWIKPSAHTKQKKLHSAPLAKATIALFQRLREQGAPGPWVFPARRTGLPRGDIRKPWARILREAGIKDLRRHDLRHSFASFLASAGTSLVIIGRLLGHTQTSTTQRYAHLADDPLRQAVEIVGNIIKPIAS
jgi:integrase